MNARELVPFAVSFAVSAIIGCGSDDSPDVAASTEEPVSTELAAGGCGRLGRPWCAGSRCKQNLACNFDHCSAGCGDLGQECCLPEQRCMPGYECNTSTMQCQTPCGALGEACCAGSSCDSGLFCNWDHCAVSCGDVGQECCLPENISMPGLTCSSGTCQ